MARWIDLDTAHGTVRAWCAEPETTIRGGVVVLQEIFGVNDHVRTVAERFAAVGFVALAPSLYDPVAPAVELDYDEAGVQRGLALRNELGFESAVDIVGAAAAALDTEGLLVGVVGFCWGGSVAFLANTRLGLPAVSYYGARTVPFLDEPLQAPMMFHFGERDASIPPEAVAEHRAKQPKSIIHVYAGADHAFNREVDARVYHRASADLAWQRTVDFFAEVLS